jgi:hypothetical protein
MRVIGHSLTLGITARGSRRPRVRDPIPQIRQWAAAPHNRSHRQPIPRRAHLPRSARAVHQIDGSGAVFQPQDAGTCTAAYKTRGRSHPEAPKAGGSVLPKPRRTPPAACVASSGSAANGQSPPHPGAHDDHRVFETDGAERRGRWTGAGAHPPLASMVESSDAQCTG